MSKQTKDDIKIEERKYNRESILMSNYFSNNEKDLLQVVLDGKKEYTLTQVKDLMNKKLKKKVT